MIIQQLLSVKHIFIPTYGFTDVLKIMFFSLVQNSKEKRLNDFFLCCKYSRKYFYYLKFYLIQFNMLILTKIFHIFQIIFSLVNLKLVRKEIKAKVEIFCFSRNNNFKLALDISYKT